MIWLGVQAGLFFEADFKFTFSGDPKKGFVNDAIYK